MPDIDQNQNQDQGQSEDDESYQLTGDDLSELHTVAQHLQAGDDPRAQKLWDVIAAQSGGGDGSGGPKFRVATSPPATSWVDDLENTLWGGSGGGESTQGVQGAGSDDDAGTSSGSDSATQELPATDHAGRQQTQVTAQHTPDPMLRLLSQQQPRQPQQQPRKGGQQSAQRQGPQPSQPPPQPTATVVVTYDKTAGIKYGSHAGLYLTGTPDGEVLYDPSGSYRQGTRGSSGLLTKDDDHVSLEDYIKYHKGTGSEVKTYTFDLSPADINRIYGRAEKQGETTGPFCSTYVSSAISGVGPFKGVQKAFFPGNLASELEEMQFAGNPNVLTPRGSGKGFGGGGGSAW